MTKQTPISMWSIIGTFVLTPAVVVAAEAVAQTEDVGFINRINTHGGLPPSSGCDANHLGTEKRVAYTADYIFYAK